MDYYSRFFVLNDDGKRVFGKGPQILLTYVQETGSLRSAAEKMGLSYGKALQIVKRAEDALGYPVLESKIGGYRGGGSCLTQDAQRFLERYNEIDQKVNQYTDELFKELFPEIKRCRKNRPGTNEQAETPDDSSL